MSDFKHQTTARINDFRYGMIEMTIKSYQISQQPRGMNLLIDREDAEALVLQLNNAIEKLGK